MADPPDPEYPDYFELRRVHPNGTMSWHCRAPSLGMVLAEQVVGLEPIRDGVWQIWFGPIYLGLFRELSKGRSEFVKNMMSA